jgi:hypothetical protein
MNNYTNADGNSSQLFFEYKPEKTAIYVVPNISANYGYILPIQNQTLSSNTYTFIYQRKPNCEMFIAPISHRKHFSKTFLSYKKYSKKLKKYLDNKRSNSYTNVSQEFLRIPSTPNGSHEYFTNIIEIDKQLTVKKTNTYLDLGGLSKIMDIFDISPSDKPTYAKSWPLCANDFKPPEPLDNYFFGSSQDDFVDDFVFDEGGI